MEVICIHVTNSHSAFKEAKQSDKALIELATRAHEPAMRSLLVRLLQAYQQEVIAAHTSEAGRKILDAESNSPLVPAVLDSVLVDEPTVTSAGKGTDDDSVNHKLSTTDPELETGPESTSDNALTNVATRLRRNVRAPLRFHHDQFDDKGNAIAEVLANPAQILPRYRYETSDSSDSDESPNEEYEGDSAASSDNEDSDDTNSVNENDDDDWSPEDDLNLLDDNVDADGPERATERDLKKLMAVDCSNEIYTEEERQLRTLLQIPTDHIYTEEDLKEPEILRRAIKLCYRARLGQSTYSERVSIHIKYTQLHPDVVARFNALHDLTPSEMESLRRQLGKEVISSE